MNKRKFTSMVKVFYELVCLKGRVSYDILYYSVFYGIPLLILISLLYQFGLYLNTVPVIPWYIFIPAGFILNILIANIILAGITSDSSEDYSTTIKSIRENEEFFKGLELSIIIASLVTSFMVGLIYVFVPDDVMHNTLLILVWLIISHFSTMFSLVNFADNEREKFL